MDVRPANAADLDRAVETITLAFATDPVWSVALARPDGSTGHLAAYWRFFVADAIDQGSVAIADGGAAVSVWIPPDGEELRPATIQVVDAFVLDALGERGGAEMTELFERFEANHPRTEPHAYLACSRRTPITAAAASGRCCLPRTFATGTSAASRPTSSRRTRRTITATCERGSVRSAGSSPFATARRSRRCGGRSAAHRRSAAR